MIITTRSSIRVKPSCLFLSHHIRHNLQTPRSTSWGTMLTRRNTHLHIRTFADIVLISIVCRQFNMCAGSRRLQANTPARGSGDHGRSSRRYAVEALRIYETPTHQPVTGTTAGMAPVTHRPPSKSAIASRSMATNLRTHDSMEYSSRVCSA